MAWHLSWLQAFSLQSLCNHAALKERQNRTGNIFLAREGNNP
jgi:hypothetical protein